ncbi:MAG: enoyl-CoA hydratase-related protein, partial [Alphaproteobacteria bacterium]
EIKAGTLADAATVKLPKRIPYHVAMEMLFSGRWMDAAEAYHHGLVNAVMPQEDLMDHVRGIARDLAAGPPLVFAAIKEVTREAENQTFQDMMNRITKRQVASVDILYDSEDNLEGAKAFAEKRDPVWKGK